MNRRNILIKSASYLACVIAVIILIIKIYAFYFTNSQSILASAIDSMFDFSSSLINLIALKFVLKPPDYRHRFGHEKIQDLTIFSQSIVFCISGILVCFYSLYSLVTQSIPSNLNYGTNIIFLSIFLIFTLLLYQTYIIKMTGSEIIRLDRLHYLTDLITNCSIIISMNLSSKFWFIDALSGLGISLYIVCISYFLFKKVVKNLVDEEFKEKDRQRILAIISTFKEVKGVHEMKTRIAAEKHFIQCHIELDGSFSLYRAHEISSNINDALLLEFPGGEIIIHLDPAGYETEVKYREII